MSANWAYNLDLLAQNNVLDFDGAAFVTGQAPRYVGRPAMPPSPYVGQVPPAPALKQPEVDEFKQEKTKLPKQEEKNENEIVKNPSWKKWAFGAIALGGIIFAAFKAKSAYNWVKDLFKGKKFKGKKLSNKFKWSNIKDYASKKWDKVKDFSGKQWNKFKNLFKSKKP